LPIASQYYWPHLTHAIWAWIRGCYACDNVKYSNQLPSRLPWLLPILETPASMVNIDGTARLPTTARYSYDCVIMIVDPLTKRVRWNEVWENNLTAEVLAGEFINMLVDIRAIPDYLISNRDMYFISDFCGSLMAQLGIKHCHSTTYFPQMDGQAENLNAVVVSFLKAYMAQCPKMWDSLVPFAEFTSNAACHKDLKTTPFQADVGFVRRMSTWLLVPTPGADQHVLMNLSRRWIHWD